MKQNTYVFEVRKLIVVRAENSSKAMTEAAGELCRMMQEDLDPHGHPVVNLPLRFVGRKEADKNGNTLFNKLHAYRVSYKRYEDDPYLTQLVYAGGEEDVRQYCADYAWFGISAISEVEAREMKSKPGMPVVEL